MDGYKITQVDGGRFLDAAECDYEDFVCDARGNRKPVERLQYGADVDRTGSFGDKSCSRVL